MILMSAFKDNVSHFAAYKFKANLLVLFIVIGITPLNAEFNGNLYFGTGFDNNIYRSDSALPTGYSSTGLNISYFPDSSYWGLNYDLGLEIVPGPASATFSTHDFSFTKSIPLNEDETDIIDFLSSVSGNINSVDFEYYDNYQFLGDLSYSHMFSETLGTELKYKAKYKNYSNLNDLNYLEQLIGLTFQTSMETKTSITGNVNLGYKGFINALIDSVSQIRQVSSDMPGHNNGSMGKPRRNNSVIVYQVVQQDPSASTITGSIKIGQSVSEKTGLSISYKQSWNLKKLNRNFIDLYHIRSINGERTGFDEVYDDPYSYESKEFTIGLTFLLPMDIKAVANTFYNKKKYSETSTLFIPKTETDVDGLTAYLKTRNDDVRKDNIAGFYLSIEKKLDFQVLFIESFSLILDYYNIRNKSNSSVNQFEAGKTLRSNPVINQLYTNNYNSSSFSVSLSADF